LYSEFVKKAIDLEDIIKSLSNGWNNRIIYTRKEIPTILIPLDWLSNLCHPIIWTGISIICGILSMSILWSESIFFAIPNFSIYERLIFVAGDTLWIQIISFIGISYIGACVYAGLFNFRLFNYYRLLPHQNTDATSILFSAAYLSRLIAPLALNFLFMINFVDSHSKIKSPFLEVIGSMSVVPILGDYFQVYFPLCIILFFTFSIFNVGDKIMRCCRRIKKFRFSDFNENKEKIEEGRELVSLERNIETSDPEAPVYEVEGLIPKKHKRKESVSLIKSHNSDKFDENDDDDDDEIPVKSRKDSAIERLSLFVDKVKNSFGENNNTNNKSSNTPPFEKIKVSEESSEDNDAFLRKDFGFKL